MILNNKGDLCELPVFTDKYFFPSTSCATESWTVECLDFLKILSL